MYGVTGNHVFFPCSFSNCEGGDHFSDPVFIISLHGSTKWNTCFLLQYAYHIHYDWSLFLNVCFHLLILPFLYPSIQLYPSSMIVHPPNTTINLTIPIKTKKRLQNKKKTKWLWNPKPKTGWWFQNCFIFASFWGKMNPFWLIFFRWVGSTTNQKPPKTLFAVPVCRGNLRNLVVWSFAKFQVWRCHRSFGHVEFLRKAATERHRSTTSGEVVDPGGAPVQ